MWYRLLACAYMGFAASAAAQIFECTNAAGVKEYAQFCPPGTVQRRQVTKAAETGGDGGSTPGSAQKSFAVQDAEYRQRLLERQQADKQSEEEQGRAEEFDRNCVEARTQLKAVQDGQRLQRFDPATGEKVVYTDDDRAEAADSQRKAIAQWCK
jgi:hypothetical protein